MTQEEKQEQFKPMEENLKQLLLKDLCARLPYGVMCNIQTRFVFEDGTLRRGSYDKILDLETVTEINSWYESNELEKLKPYLRSMSSMTKEEKSTYLSYCECDDGDFTDETLYFNTIESFDYLNQIHIDYRNLIPKGLAIEAPEGMYNTKTE